MIRDQARRSSVGFKGEVPFHERVSELFRAIFKVNCLAIKAETASVAFWEHDPWFTFVVEWLFARTSIHTMRQESMGVPAPDLVIYVRVPLEELRRAVDCSRLLKDEAVATKLFLMFERLAVDERWVIIDRDVPQQMAQAAFEAIYPRLQSCSKKGLQAEWTPFTFPFPQF